MAVISEAEFSKSLRQGPLLPVYLLYGKERFLSENALKELIRRAVPKGTENFNFQKFDGAAFDLTSLTIAAEGMPLLSETKCVLLMNPNLEKLKKEDAQGLLALMEDPNPSTVLILYISAFELNPKKSARVKKFIEAAGKSGAAVEFAPRSSGDLSRYLRNRFEKAGVKAPAAVIGAFIERCGTDLAVLTNESDKLIAYKGGEGELTREDVEAVTRKSLDASVFDLSRQLLRGSGDAAFSTLNELFLLREEPLAILGALNAAFLDLYRAKAALAGGKREGDVAALFNYKGRDFRIRNAFRDASRYSLNALSDCLQLLSDTDVRLKSQRTDGKIALEELLAAVMNRCRRGDSR